MYLNTKLRFREQPALLNCQRFAYETHQFALEISEKGLLEKGLVTEARESKKHLTAVIF